MDTTNTNRQEPLSCRVLRCSRQDEMYLYLRADLDEAELPEALRQRLGRLSLAMELELHAGRPLARADVSKVMAALYDPGYYLQMPPQVQAHLHFGD